MAKPPLYTCCFKTDAEMRRFLKEAKERNKPIILNAYKMRDYEEVVVSPPRWFRTEFNYLHTTYRIIVRPK